MSRELKIENQLDSHLKQIKVGETSAPIEIATDKVRINEKLTLDKDLQLNGNLNLGGTVGTLNFPDQIVLESSESFGGLNLECNSLAILAALWGGSDGDTGNNPAVLTLFPSAGQDARINLYGNASVQWTIGNDSDDSDKLKFDANSALVGGATKLTLADNGDLTTVGDVSIAATKKISLDGGGDTYITEASADVVRYYVGNDRLVVMSNNGADGNQVHFQDSSAGFTQLEPTYDATATVVDFRHSNKQNLTFGAGSITNVQLYFPTVSGNFQLLIKQDGTGSRTITNYKVYEFDESTADGSAAAVFAGGSNPTLTTDANHVDILSFYWDADNEIAYGVATLDFQF